MPGGPNIPGGSGPDVYPGEPDPAEVAKLKEAWAREKAAREAAEKAAKALRRPPPWFLRWLRGGLYLALAYLLVTAVADHFVKQKPLASGHGPCTFASGPAPAGIPLSASRSATGPNGALKAALADLDAQCAASGLNCTGGTCPTGCAPDAAVQTVDIKTRIFWYTVDATAICQCYCT